MHILITIIYHIYTNSVLHESCDVKKKVFMRQIATKAAARTRRSCTLSVEG